MTLILITDIVIGLFLAYLNQKKSDSNIEPVQALQIERINNRNQDNDWYIPSYPKTVHLLSDSLLYYKNNFLK